MSSNKLTFKLEAYADAADNTRYKDSKASIIGLDVARYSSMKVSLTSNNAESDHYFSYNGIRTSDNAVVDISNINTITLTAYTLGHVGSLYTSYQIEIY